MRALFASITVALALVAMQPPATATPPEHPATFSATPALAASVATPTLDLAVLAPADSLTVIAMENYLAIADVSDVAPALLASLDVTPSEDARYRSHAGPSKSLTGASDSTSTPNVARARDRPAWRS